MQKITPFLWFKDQAEEAVNFYTSIFKDSKIIDVSRYEEEGAEIAQIPAGNVMSITYELNGQRFMALNGGPVYTFTPAISFFISCENQEEVDDYWDKLTEGGEEGKCGWIQDKYGVSWQIVPDNLGELLSDPDPIKAQRVMSAMLQMSKLDIQKLKQAREEK